MACFRQHISVGALVAIIGVVLAYHYAYLTDWRLLMWLFVVTAVASFLPDVDSDSSVPFYLVFGLVTVCATGLAFLYTLTAGTDNIYELVGQPLLTFVITWFVFGGIVKRFTKHRGMFHSIPAALVLALSVLLVARAFSDDDFATLLLAGGAGVGYITHLVLDEMYASVSVDGHIFKARKSLGTALKFFSASRMANIFTYILLAVLLYSAFV